MTEINELQEISVKVHFDGTVTAKVPKRLNPKDAEKIAQLKVLGNILATTSNVDAPEEDAFEDYLEDCSPKAKYSADYDWDNTNLEDVSGIWSLV